MPKKALVINPTDNVATAIAEIDPEVTVSVAIGEESKTFTVKEKIPFGHKFALRDIIKGESIIKYGQKIGRATQNISMGHHVHVHNVESIRGRGDIEVET